MLPIALVASLLDPAETYIPKPPVRNALANPGCGCGSSARPEDTSPIALRALVFLQTLERAAVHVHHRPSRCKLGNYSSGHNGIQMAGRADDLANPACGGGPAQGFPCIGVLATTPRVPVRGRHGDVLARSLPRTIAKTSHGDLGT